VNDKAVSAEALARFRAELIRAIVKVEPGRVTARHDT
jgi:hypothetical protein